MKFHTGRFLALGALAVAAPVTISSLIPSEEACGCMPPPLHEDVVAPTTTSPSGRPARPVVAAEEFVDRTNAAGFALQGELATGDDNAVISPISVAAAFALAQPGAADDATRQALWEAFGLPTEDAAALVAELLGQMAPSDHAEEGPPYLTVANGIWVDERVRLAEAYRTTVEDDLGARVDTGDFRGDGGGVAEAINGWIAEQTEDRITDLVSPEALAEAEFALVNALYFQATWSSEFDEAVDGDFTTSGGETVTVPMMSQRHDLQYTVTERDTTVVVPLQDHYEMVIVMPEAGVDDFVEQLDASTWNHRLGILSTGDVILSMPTFDVATTDNISDLLEAVGITVPGGDYSDMAPGASIDAVIHGANLTVDEVGVEGAAATAAIGAGAAEAPETTAPPVVIDIDQPFVFAVRDTNTGLNLFTGQIADPSAAQ